MPVRSMYVDVDLTLVGDDLKLYPGVREKLQQWSNKYTIICWSHGGKEHAERVCKKHKIDKFFSDFLDKPDIIVDDNPTLLLDFAAILKVKDQRRWWKQGDDDIFRGSRADIQTKEGE